MLASSRATKRHATFGTHRQCGINNLSLNSRESKTSANLSIPLRKPGKQEKDVFLEHFRQVQPPPVCENSIRRQGKKRGDGDQGDEEMEKKSVSKLISSLSISPFLRARHDRRQTCYVFLNSCLPGFLILPGFTQDALRWVLISDG